MRNMGDIRSGKGGSNGLSTSKGVYTGGPRLAEEGRGFGLCIWKLKVPSLKEDFMYCMKWCGQPQWCLAPILEACAAYRIWFFEVYRATLLFDFFIGSGWAVLWNCNGCDRLCTRQESQGRNLRVLFYKIRAPFLGVLRHKR